MLIALLTGFAGRANAETVTTIQEVIDANGSVVTLDMDTNRFQVLYFGSSDENYLWDGERGYMFYRNGCDWSALVGAEPGTYINGSWNVQWETNYSDIAINGEVNITKGDKAELKYIECTGAEAVAKYDFTCVKIEGSYDVASNQFTATDGTVFTINDNWHDGLPARPATSADGVVKALKNGTTLIPLEEGYFEGETANILSALKGLADGTEVSAVFPAGSVQFVAGGKSGEYTYMWDGTTGVRFYGLTLTGAQAGSYVEGAIAGQYVAEYNDIQYFTENTLALGGVAPLKARAMSGSELTQADGQNLYAYVELTGNYTGYSFTTTDGVTFSVFDFMGVMACPAGSGKGKIKALYLGDTNNGGQQLYMLSHTAHAEINITDRQAVDAARAFLLARGYGEMEMSYSSRFDGIMTVNFAAVQNGVVLYPDLVKVQVSMADGAIVGLEAKNYLMNHVPRTLEIPALSEQDAIDRIGGSLTPVSARLCVIPENTSEYLCYEVTATSGQDTFLVYIDAVTGIERKLMQVISDENGALVM